jgi:hypothetical protein
MRPFPDWAR